jgi:hypothetical protein
VNSKTALGIFAVTMVTAASCKGNPVAQAPAPQADHSGLGSDWRAKLAASIEAFKNRKRYNHLTPEILGTIPDADVERAVMDFVDCKEKHLGGSTREALSSLPAGFRAVYCTWWVEAEVYNGGFNQYFWNSSGQFASDAVAGFELIGAPALARLMERAIAVHEQDAARLEPFMAENTAEAFSQSYEANPLEALDHEFYRLDSNTDIRKTRIRFIRANPQLFVGECQAS